MREPARTNRICTSFLGSLLLLGFPRTIWARWSREILRFQVQPSAEGGGDLDTSLAHPSMPTWSSLGSVFNYRVPHTWLRAYTTIQPPSICSPHPSSAQMLEQGPCQGPRREEESAHRHPAPNLSPSWYILQIHSKISKPGSL